jgi:hypothetical protein
MLSYKSKTIKELFKYSSRKYWLFPTIIPFTDASEINSAFKLERAVCTKGCEASTDPGILKPTQDYLTCHLHAQENSQAAYEWHTKDIPICHVEAFLVQYDK